MSIDTANSLASVSKTQISYPDNKDCLLINELLEDLETYLNPDQVKEVYQAYLFGADAHDGQKRLSGEPYINHPVSVAKILARLKLDHKCLIAALLHDIIEDTQLAKDQLAQEFDSEIAELVDGVSKLTHLKFSTPAEAQAENFRKMLFAMTQDIRVILIKLADRLHNMRTLRVMKPAKARRIARETLEIYAPIANRLGINSIRHELEELGMAAHWPWRDKVLKNALKKLSGNHRELIADVEKRILDRLRQEGLSGEVRGRQKRIYSVYQKMFKKKLSLSELADVFAFRIVVDSVDSCYRIMGVVHNLYRPMPGRFKDYIAIPKANGYQSLHTVLFGPQGIPIEIQIRTSDMHEVAEEGIAAHWQYKDTKGGRITSDAASEWLRNLLEVQKSSGDSLEFLEHVKMDLFSDEVYIFTPRGKIIVLPRGSTVIDFAYAVHSDIGNQCVAARVNRRLAPLRTQLYSGLTIEIITKTDASPKPSWLNFVVTGKARANIRSFLKRLENREASVLGKRMLVGELKQLGHSLEELQNKEINQVVADLGYENFDNLLVQIGLGNRMARLVARLLVAAEPHLAEDEGAVGSLSIQGSEGLVVSYGKCCGPVPDDPVIATFSPGRGMVVHHQQCPNLEDFRRQGQSWVDVQWDKLVDGEFSTLIRVDAGNQRGILATIAAAIAAEGSNIEDVRSEERDGLSMSLRFVINVKNRRHLASIFRRIRITKGVYKISRIIG